MKIKLLVNEWFKEYEVLEVSKECFENSPQIENAGTMTGFKINDEEHLNFLIQECKEKGFKEVKI